MAIENRLAEIQQDLITLPGNTSNLIAPVSSDVLEDAATKAMIAVHGEDNYESSAEYYKSKSPFSAMTDLIYTSEVSENYMAGKAEVGITASQGKMGVYCSIFDLGVVLSENVPSRIAGVPQESLPFKINLDGTTIKLGNK